MNTIIDYGVIWGIYEETNVMIQENYENNSFFLELQYFYQKDEKEKLYVKACYLHHLLDFFKETHINIYNIELVFKRFLRNKAILEITDKNGEIVNFRKEIEELFTLLRENKQQFYDDLKGPYLLSLKKEKKNLL